MTLARFGISHAKPTEAPLLPKLAVAVKLGYVIKTSVAQKTDQGLCLHTLLETFPSCQELR